MTTHGRLKFGGFTMAKLARVCGSDAKAKNLFLAGAARVDPALLGVYAASTPTAPLVGTTFQGTVPVIEPGGSISMVTAKWLVLGWGRVYAYPSIQTHGGVLLSVWPLIRTAETRISSCIIMYHHVATCGPSHPYRVPTCGLFC